MQHFLHTRSVEVVPLRVDQAPVGVQIHTTGSELDVCLHRICDLRFGYSIADYKVPNSIAKLHEFAFWADIMDRHDWLAA